MDSSDIAPVTVKVTDRTLQLLDEFDLVSEDDYAAAVGTTPKTLRNTPHVDLPAFVRIGRKRFFIKSSIKQRIQERIVNAG